VLAGAIEPRARRRARAGRSQGHDYARYKGATLITPNRKEAEEALGRKLAT
jgi:bifunctional ADP-heptose synthase (sugar kinase/adenylyltransferase)